MGVWDKIVAGATTVAGGVGGFLIGGPPGAIAGAGAGATLGASIVGAEQAAENTEAANATNIQLSREQMQFQEAMSGSAYQRAVKDMQLAGLNPMLAIKNGGASTPSGAMARVEAVPSTMAAISNSAMAVADTLARVNAAAASANEADTKAALNTVSLANVQADTEVRKNTAKNVSKDTEVKGSVIDLNRIAAGKEAVQKKLLETQMQGAKNAQWRSEQMAKAIEALGWISDRMRNGATKAAKWTDRLIDDTSLQDGVDMW